MIGIIIQARTGSSRFPRKIYEDLNGKYTLQRVLEGCTKSKLANLIVLAMPEYDEAEFTDRLTSGQFKDCVDNRFRTYFGSSDDLVDRYYQAAQRGQIDLIVRVTADCPLIQADIIDKMLIEYLRKGHNGFMGNNECIGPVPYPDGTDVEIFPFWMLADVHMNVKDPSDREHVTPYMYRDRTRYNVYEFHNKVPNPVISMKFQGFSFDTDKDYEVLMDLTKHYDQHKDLNMAIHLTPYRKNK